MTKHARSKTIKKWLSYPLMLIICFLIGLIFTSIFLIGILLLGLLTAGLYYYLNIVVPMPKFFQAIIVVVAITSLGWAMLHELFFRSSI